jgi:hypothetical protein
VLAELLEHVFHLLEASRSLKFEKRGVTAQGRK